MVNVSAVYGKLTGRHTVYGVWRKCISISCTFCFRKCNVGSNNNISYLPCCHVSCWSVF